MGEIKKQPATPLPWRSAATNSGTFIAGATRGYHVEVRPVTSEKQVKQDADFIVHAANAYGPLVEALKNVLRVCDSSEDFRVRHGSGVAQAAALLRSLGEYE